MLKVLGAALSFTVMALAGYALITENFGVMPYVFFLLGVLIAGLGIRELKAKRTTNAIASILASAFILFVSIYTF